MKQILVLAALIAAPAMAQDAPVQSAPAVEATAAPVPVQAQPLAPPSAAHGKIVFYRQSSIMGMGLGCPIRYKGQEIVELGRGKFAEWDVPAGSYIINNKTASLQVIVQPGEASYVRCQIKPGFMTGRADLQIVDEESFNQHKTEFERKEVNFTPSAAR